MEFLVYKSSDSCDRLLTRAVELITEKQRNYPSDEQAIWVDKALSELIDKKPVDYQRFVKFVNDNLFDLRLAMTLDRNDTEVTKSSYFPLVAYYVAYYDQFLREEWPLSHEQLLWAFRVMGYSYGAY